MTRMLLTLLIVLMGILYHKENPMAKLMDETAKGGGKGFTPTKPAAAPAKNPAWMGRMNLNPDEGYVGFQTPTSSTPVNRPAFLGNMGGGMGQNMTGYTAANANAQNPYMSRPANVGYFEEAATQEARRRAGLPSIAPMMGTSDTQYQNYQGGAPSYQPQPPTNKPEELSDEEALAIAQAGQNPNSWMGQNDPHHLMNPAIDYYPASGPLLPWWAQATAQPATPTVTAPPSMMSAYGYGGGGGSNYRRKGFGSSYGGNWGGGGGGYSDYQDPAWLANMGLYSLKWG